MLIWYIAGVLLITKVALLEFQFGDLARGEAMLDRTLSDHPRRTDVWLLYANGLIKKLHYDKARSGLFYRLV